MARIIPVGFAEASIIYESTQGTAPFVTTVGFESIVEEPETYTDMADTILSFWQLQFAPVTSDAVVIDRVELAVGLPGGSSGSVLSTLDPEPGAFAGQMAPVTCAAILRKSTADLGRKGRGRCFLPASVPSDEVGFGGQLTTSWRNNLATRWLAFLAAMRDGSVGEPHIPYLLHNEVGAAPSPFFSGGVSEKVGYIRGRTF